MQTPRSETSTLISGTMEGSQKNNVINHSNKTWSVWLKLVALLVCISSSFSFFAAMDRTPEDILAQHEKQLAQYTPSVNVLEEIILEMPYAKSNILSAFNKIVLTHSHILEVTLVFTDYPKGASLHDLNLSRIYRIGEIKEELITNWRIKWNIIRQTGCNSEEEAKTMFHGIILRTSDPDMNRNLLSLDNVFKGLKSKKEAKRIIMQQRDTTVFSVLNKLEAKNMTVVCDFTSSMYEHSGQLLLWFVLNTQQTKFSHVVFFNDGDMKEDAEKKDGAAGGIYTGASVDANSMLKLAEKTASRGIGGKDMEENDLEALQYAMKNYPQSRGYILIADNDAPPRDMSLLKTIKKPVHVILCGVNKINVPKKEYMNLALSTGGSLHTMQQSITNLSQLKEGQIINFCGSSFKLSQGNLVYCSSNKN
jgi:hypothetical protein